MSLDRLLQGEIARYAFRAVMRDLTARQRAGLEPPEFAEDLLEQLEEAAQRRHLPAAASGTAPASVDLGTAWVSTGEAADAVVCSERWVRALVNSGRVRSRRIDGRSRQVDLDSLRGVIAAGRERT